MVTSTGATAAILVVINYTVFAAIVAAIRFEIFLVTGGAINRVVLGRGEFW